MKTKAKMLPIRTKEQDYVVFLSPGTFCDETSKCKIGSWDTKKAMKLSEKIVERHGAKPYAFVFEKWEEAGSIPTTSGSKLNVESRMIKSSGLHFINGKVMSYDEVPDTKDNATLRSNMRCNDLPYVCETRNSYRHTGAYGEKDVVVNNEGKIVDKGNDKAKQAYRRAFKDKKE